MQMVNVNQIAQDLFGSIDWITSDRGYMKCPGEVYHTGRTLKKDCRIITSGAPTIYCFHSSCSGMIEEANLKLRKACTGKEFEKKILTAEEVQAIREKQREKRIGFDLEMFSGVSKETIFNKWEWSPADMYEESPIGLDFDVEQDSRIFLTSLFNFEDVVWIGDVRDSGEPENSENFKTVYDWMFSKKFNFTCPATFKKGVYSRSNENVLERKYLVIESDVLTQDQICAVFNFCRKFMNLRAVIYTGGKSLHGWFNFPSMPTIDILKQLLPPMGCDPALFKPAQPVRLPGVKRGEKMQSLLYLNP